MKRKSTQIELSPGVYWILTTPEHWSEFRASKKRGGFLRVVEERSLQNSQWAIIEVFRPFSIDWEHIRHGSYSPGDSPEKIGAWASADRDENGSIIGETLELFERAEHIASTTNKIAWGLTLGSLALLIFGRNR